MEKVGLGIRSLAAGERGGGARAGVGVRLKPEGVGVRSK
jgi:hypothetical protein